MTNQKTMIITAASKGMGNAIAHELYERGYQLALMSTSGATDLVDEERVLSLKGSATNVKDLSDLVEQTIGKFGHIDGVVNNTGHASTGDLLSLTDEQWHDGLNLLLLNVVRTARLVTPYFLEQGYGSIVNISAFSAAEPTLDYPISSAIRAGLSSFTKLYVKRYAKNNLRMNSVLPGFIENYDVAENVLAQIPMHRPGKLSEIAKTVAFLLSDDAAYINGQNILVDGGLVKSF